MTCHTLLRVASPAVENPPDGDGTRPPVPFHAPTPSGNELRYVAQAAVALRARHFEARAVAELERRLAADTILLTASATTALELAALVCGLGPGDEVIMPSFTFPSTANAIVRCGAKPVFVDIRADTLTLDSAAINDALTERTRAIVPVHYAGAGADMDRIVEVARRHTLTVIEDAALAVDAQFRGHALGTLGELGCLSFHYTKNLHCGEGGALLVNRPDLVERATWLRDNGTNRQAFLDGSVREYHWVAPGTNGKLNELSCAFLCAQLERADAINAACAAAHGFYMRHLQNLADGSVTLPVVPDGCDSNCHAFFLLVEDDGTAGRLRQHLSSRGIGAASHYAPLHLSPMGRQLGYSPGDLPVTERAARSLLRLPVYEGLTVGQLQHVVDEVQLFFAAQDRISRSASVAAHRRASR